MQNIPSHATDIRHMFRATPASEELVGCSTCENDTNVMNVTLGRWASVENSQQVDVLVNDLKPGDLISVQNQLNDTCLAEVLTVEDNKHDLSMCDITLKLSSIISFGNEYES